MLTLKNATKTALLEMYAWVLRKDPNVDEEHFQAFTNAAEEATVEQLYSVLIERAAWDSDCAEAVKRYPKVAEERKSTMNTKNTTATKTTKNVSKKEGTTMTKKTTKTEKNVKPVETKSAEAEVLETLNISKKELVGMAVDAWLEHYKKDCEGNGSSVIIKTWEKIPTCRALRVDNVTYFEIYYSAKGVRLCAKSKFIPEDIRPEGATIIQNGLDLCIPTFPYEDILQNLDKYADACRKSIVDAKAAKEKAKAEKEAERKAKEAERKAKAAETKAAAK